MSTLQMQWTIEKSSPNDMLPMILSVMIISMTNPIDDIYLTKDYPFIPAMIDLSSGGIMSRHPIIRCSIDAIIDQDSRENKNSKAYQQTVNNDY